MFAYCERISLPSLLLVTLSVIVLLLTSCSDSNIHSVLAWPHATCELPFYCLWLWCDTVWQSSWCNDLLHFCPKASTPGRSNWYLQCNTDMAASSTQLPIYPFVNSVWLWNGNNLHCQLRASPKCVCLTPCLVPDWINTIQFRQGIFSVVLSPITPLVCTNIKNVVSAVCNDLSLCLCLVSGYICEVHGNGRLSVDFLISE